MNPTDFHHFQRSSSFSQNKLINYLDVPVEGSDYRYARSVIIFRGEQPVNNQQSSEAEDDQHTQVCELDIENISSTVFIL